MPNHYTSRLISRADCELLTNTIRPVGTCITGSTGRCFWISLIATTIFVTALLVAHNWSFVTSVVVPDGDLAADMLLLERAGRGWLLTGHYSRFEFNHPGPFFLSARHLTESLFGAWLPSPYSAQLLGLLAVNALFVGIAAGASAVIFAGGAASMAMAAATTVAVVLLQDNGVGVLANPWMPSVLIAPFFAFALSLAAIARGPLWMLPVATFCGCALVHGYAPMPLFVGVPLLLVLAREWIRHERRIPRGPFAASAAVVGLFVAPLVLDALLNRPGNVAAIVRVGRRLPPSDPASLQQIAAFVWQYWMLVQPVVWVIAAIGAIVAAYDPRTRMALGRVLAVAAAMTLLLALYSWRAPKPLYPFIGQFYTGVPLAVAATAVAAAVSLAMRTAASRLTVTAVLVSITAAAWVGNFAGQNQHKPPIQELIDGVVASPGGSQPYGVRLSFKTHDYWPFASGLLLELGRRSVPACVDAPHLAFLFTPERICSQHGAARHYWHYEIVAASTCDTTCIVRSESIEIGLATQASRAASM